MLDEDDPHTGDLHVGRGFSQFPYQLIQWSGDDRRTFRTSREDEFAWTVPG